MLFQYANVLFGLLFGALFVVLNIEVVNRILAPKVKDPHKTTVYECGEPAVGSAWVRFDMRFYTMALVFLVFEVETAVMFPWAAVFRRLRQLGGDEHGMFAFLEMAVFILILGVGLVYVWAKGDLDWVKSAVLERRNAAEAPRAETR
ncbi:MAG TPA: NADH-quinone oxidoreductase subunit A [Planctomycetota bacterium]|nr:NADH-quinone oxidoreductase subunit A [Planctomycetota bacterium]